MGRLEEGNRVFRSRRPSSNLMKSGSLSIYNLSPSVPNYYGVQPTNPSIKSWASNHNESQGYVISPKSYASAIKTYSELRRLSQKEWRAEGICFACDEKWAAGHRKKEFSSSSSSSNSNRAFFLWIEVMILNLSRIFDVVNGQYRH